MDLHDKESVRRQMLEWRENELTAGERTRKSRRICSKLFDIPEVRHARGLMAYAPVNQEVDLVSFLEECSEQIQLYLPKIDGNRLRTLQVPDRSLLLKSLQEGRPLEGYSQTPHGIIEPVVTDTTSGNSHDPEVVLVPGVVFDGEGNRIGYGKGYYDRYLGGPGQDTFKIGICYAEQLTEEQLPTDSHDVPVDRVVTDA